LKAYSFSAASLNTNKFDSIAVKQNHDIKTENIMTFEDPKLGKTRNKHQHAEKNGH
jgi:hypothetical protein